MPLPSNLRFVSLLQYSPNGTSDESLRSRVLTYALKRDGTAAFKIGSDLAQARVIERAAKAIATGLTEHKPLASCFGPEVTLIPIPRSAPLVPGGLWPTKVIAEELVANGMGAEVLPCLLRTQAIQKSATAGAGQRATPEKHFDTVAVDQQMRLRKPSRITLVDDVITRGATFIGIIRHIETAFPHVPIDCFAVIRTMSGVEVTKIFDPIEGTITYAHGRLHREP